MLAQTAAEAAVKLYPSVKDRLLEIDRIVIHTHESAIRIISKVGPLNNPADRDHCLQYMVAVPLAFGNLVAESARLSDELQLMVANLETPSQLADVLAHHLAFDVKGKQRVLEQPDVAERLKQVLSQVNKESEALQIETEIKEKVQTEMGRTQREYMLRQQLEAIRRELEDRREPASHAEPIADETSDDFA